MARNGRIAHRRLKTALLGGAAAALLASAAMAQDASIRFDIASQDASSALNDFSRQSGVRVLFPYDAVAGKHVQGLHGDMTVQQALDTLAKATGLTIAANDGQTVTLTAPQSGSAAGDGADGTVEALIVTAQKREENIQDVPIAMSAFTQEALERSQVTGGPDLMTQVPNMTFTKTNFSSYSIQLRGIGTQAISATTDAAVAVAFNNTPFIRNRFFEQEFYDLQRVEVLRGPQGTLYGRNATAGVVNIISAKPKFRYEAKLSADLGNYNSSRFEGMVNVPLVEDKVALRLAGAWTKRNGYVTNQLTGDPIDGRDLWSSRLSLRFAPTDRLDVNLIWEHFQEDDDRLRSGKQLCKTDEVTEVGGIPVNHYTVFPGPQQPLRSGIQATFSQGCAPNSLYDKDSFQTPNGLSLPYYVPLGSIFLPTALDDPYVSRTQSTDLRVIESAVNPQYRAKSDLGELQVSFDLTDNLTLASETAYSTDTVFSTQDFNRFNTAAGAWDNAVGGGADRPGVLTPGPNGGGIFCDPQIGCSDRLVAVDLSTAKSRQFSQEFRVSSDFGGPLNFSLGANFLRYDTEDKYYVFINSLTMISAIAPFGTRNQLSPYVGGVTDNRECLMNGILPGDPDHAYNVGACTYIDPNPIDNLNDMGHNYFLSRNPYKLISYAAFGEVYYKLTENLKITGGLRWTVDKKEAPRIPSWLLASQSVGYPVAEVIEQEWREPTGRLAVDWKPHFRFTDATLLYGSYAHGYKAGGANPPGFVQAYYSDPSAALAYNATSATRPKIFKAEYVNAFELGAKNTLMGGRMTLNLAGFYYDYTDYQISEIVDRSAFNRNFDATVWGLEIEADWRPLENLRFGFKGGYEDTRIADGERAVDLMDRTAGHPGWVVVRPFPTYASNCVLPVSLYAYGGGLHAVGAVGGGHPGGCELVYIKGEHVLGFDPADYPEINNGEGFYKDLSGNALPNAPKFTATLTADYTLPLPNDWLMTLHTDLYYQSEAWTRVFNTDGYDKLKAYNNINLAAIFTNEEAGWKVMAYVKNVLDRTSITGAFLNSDDTGLTTNVFLTEPRLYGLRVTKEWTGAPWWSGRGAHDPNQPWPFTLELSGQAQRHDASNETYRPDFLDSFASQTDPSGKQSEDLDWGDGRSIKLTYATSSGWKVALGARTSETNRGERALLEGETFIICDSAAGCDGANATLARTFTNYGATHLAHKEEQTIVDFLVGRDVGMGSLGDAALSVGLRYASLKSHLEGTLYGTPDWVMPTGPFVFSPTTHHHYTASLDADRTFKGAGPVLSWEASKRLASTGEMGHVDVDWSVTGGVLFGKQQATATGLETSAFYSQKYGDWPKAPENQSATPLDPPHRSKSVTVPTLDLSLGLSYKVDRFKVGAGYSWERYFDAIDGGITEHKSYDRTVDGPYFKLSVGFGG